jgi:ribosomal protein S6
MLFIRFVVRPGVYDSVWFVWSLQHIAFAPTLPLSPFDCAHLSTQYHSQNHTKLSQTEPRIDFKALTALVKQVSLKVVENGGIVRSIQNHGLRQFPHRFQAKYPDYLTQQRYYDQGRFISIYYDANPETLKQVETILNMNDQVLRATHLRARSKLDWIAMERQDKNPYVQKVLRHERDTLERRKAEDMAIATAATSVDATVESLVDDM